MLLSDSSDSSHIVLTKMSGVEYRMFECRARKDEQMAFAFSNLWGVYCLSSDDRHRGSPLSTLFLLKDVVGEACGTFHPCSSKASRYGDVTRILGTQCQPCISASVDRLILCSSLPLICAGVCVRSRARAPIYLNTSDPASKQKYLQC